MLDLAMVTGLVVCQTSSTGKHEERNGAWDFLEMARQRTKQTPLSGHRQAIQWWSNQETQMPVGPALVGQVTASVAITPTNSAALASAGSRSTESGHH